MIIPGCPLEAGGQLIQAWMRRIIGKNPGFTSQVLNYHDTCSEGIVRPGQYLVLESRLDYHYNPNAVPGLMQSYYKWNAAVIFNAKY